MKQYLDLMKDILENGERMENRTGTDTLSLFGRQIRFDLRGGFPLVTTKKTHFRSIAHELLWMLSGSNRIDYLRENNVTIWDEWAAADYRPELGYEDGDLGPVYGVQWRNWVALHPIGGSYATLVLDQVAGVVDKLRNKPQDRRIILSAWNVGDIDRMKLPPCHCFAQFSVRGNGLSCQMYIRSWDFFLGGPFNIAQYALLTHMLAHVTGHEPNELIISAGDVHLYVNHLEQARAQIERCPYPLPTLVLNGDVREIDDFTFDDIKLVGYQHLPALKGEVAV